MLSVFIEFFDSYIKIFEIYSVVDQFELGSYCCSWLNSSFRVCCNNIQLKLARRTLHIQIYTGWNLSKWVLRSFPLSSGNPNEAALSRNPEIKESVHHINHSGKSNLCKNGFLSFFFILSWCDSEGERLDTWDGSMSLALQTLAVPDVADDAECGRGGGPPAPLPHFPGTALSWTVQYLLFQSYSEPPLTPSAQRGRHASVLGRSSCRSCCRFRFSCRCRFKFRWNHW